MAVSKTQNGESSKCSQEPRSKVREQSLENTNNIPHTSCSSGMNQNEPGTNNDDNACCPSCDLTVEDGLNCENCSAWYHYSCESIDNAERMIHENTDSEYICLACKYEKQCDGISENLTIENRNTQESDPVCEQLIQTVNISHTNCSEETYRKEGYEPGPIIATHCDIGDAGTPVTVKSVKEISRYINCSNSPGNVRKSQTQSNFSQNQTQINSKQGHPSVQGGYNDVKPKDRKQGGTKNENGKNGQYSVEMGTIVVPDKVINVSGRDSPIIEQKAKQTRKIAKHKIKEAEQEEQLKLAKSVIHNLERKLSEVENSNKLMRQELSLVKIEKGEGIVNNETTQKTVQPVCTDEMGHGQTPTNRHQTQIEMHSLKERITSLEMENLKNRILNLERNVSLQPQVHACYHGQQPYLGLNSYGSPMGMQLHQNPLIGGTLQPYQPFIHVGGYPVYGGVPVQTTFQPQHFLGVPQYGAHHMPYMRHAATN